MPRLRTYLFLDLPAFIFVVLAIVHITQKPGLPQPYSLTGELTINGTQLHGANEIEFFLGAFRPGDTVTVNTSSQPVRVQLTREKDGTHIALDAFAALLILLMGVFVNRRRPGEPAVNVFHFAALLTAMSIAGAKTIYWLEPGAVGFALCAVFFAVYAVVPVSFLHFSYVFPGAHWPPYRRLVLWLYTAAVIVAGWGFVLYQQAAAQASITLYREFVPSSKVQNAFGVIMFLWGITNLVVAYRQTTTTMERKKLRWVLYGLTVGPAPFVLLWALPQAFGFSPWIAEWAFELFLLFIPATFAISILKYRLLDIDVLINRSVVYTIVVAGAVALYLLTLFLATKFIVTSLTTEASIIVATVAAALLALGFEPMRRKVQSYIDRRFFRVQYSFQKSVRKLIDDLKHCLDIPQLAASLVNHVDTLLAVERIGFFTVAPAGGRVRPAAHRGFDLLVSHGVRFESEKLRSQLNLPVALDGTTEDGVEHESADAEVFQRWGIALVFPILSGEKEILGFFVLGPKKSGLRFSADDFDLLLALVAQAGAAMVRLHLQRRLLLEHAETQRLEELNRLKSYFVSGVSHDLKTPLTSIKMFADILRRREEQAGSDASEYLEIIEGEADRLTRLINDVLDFARIEKGVREYTFRETDLNELVERALVIMKYQLKMNGFIVSTELAAEVITLEADPDAIVGALVNLLSNALKYSHQTREVDVSTRLEESSAAVRIADKGMGIPAEELPHLFEPFWRAKETTGAGAGGAGLGLALVKDVVDAHHGTIEVESDVGRGSVFTLLLPLARRAKSQRPEEA